MSSWLAFRGVSLNDGRGKLFCPDWRTGRGRRPKGGRWGTFGEDQVQSVNIAHRVKRGLWSNEWNQFSFMSLWMKHDKLVNRLIKDSLIGLSCKTYFALHRFNGLFEVRHFRNSSGMRMERAVVKWGMGEPGREGRGAGGARGPCFTRWALLLEK